MNKNKMVLMKLMIMMVLPCPLTQQQQQQHQVLQQLYFLLYPHFHRDHQNRKNKKKTAWEKCSLAHLIIITNNNNSNKDEVNYNKYRYKYKYNNYTQQIINIINAYERLNRTVYYPPTSTLTYTPTQPPIIINISDNVGSPKRKICNSDNVGNRLSRLIRSNDVNDVNEWSSSKVKNYLNRQAHALVQVLKKCRQTTSTTELGDVLRHFILMGRDSTPQLLLLNWMVFSNSLSVTLVMRDLRRLPEKLRELHNLVDFGSSSFKCDQWIVALMIEEPFFFEITRVCDFFLHALKCKCSANELDQPTETRGTPCETTPSDSQQHNVETWLGWKGGLPATDFSELLLLCRISTEFDRLLQVVWQSGYRDYFLKKCPWFLTHLQHWALQMSSVEDRMAIPELDKAMHEHEKLIRLVLQATTLLPSQLHSTLTMMMKTTSPTQQHRASHHHHHLHLHHHQQVEGFTVDFEPVWIWSSDGSQATQVDWWWNIAKVKLFISQSLPFAADERTNVKESQALLLDSPALEPGWSTTYPLPPIPGFSWLRSKDEEKHIEFEAKMGSDVEEMFKIRPENEIKTFLIGYDPTLKVEKLLADGFNSWATIFCLTIELCDDHYR